MASLDDVACPFGLGTARGAEDDRTDELMAQIIALALSSGIRVFDTAVNYRSGRSETVLGQAIADAVAGGNLDRSDVVVMTKGGYPRPAADDARSSGGEAAASGPHSLDPGYIREQIDLSLATLGVGIDVYYVHNPEQQAVALTREEYWSKLASVITLLEEKVSDGSIASYGVASWRISGGPAPYPAVDVAELCRLASSVAGGPHHLSAIQAPLSLLDRTILRPSQRVGNRTLSLPSACAEVGVALVASASAGRGLSPQLAAASSRWVTSVPGVTTALVGTLNDAHLRQTLTLNNDKVESHAWG